MALQSWLDRSRMQFDAYGPKGGLAAASRSLWSGLAHRASALRTVHGEPIYEREWDLLIVLDACRVDALEEVASEYDFLPNDVPTIYSVAPNSHLWLARNFRPQYLEEISQTAYVSGNSHTEGFREGTLEPEEADFAHLEKVYEYGFDSVIGTVPPQTMTDVTIDYLRAHDPDRTIVHFMQPHTPYRDLDTDAIGGVPEKHFRETVWDLIMSGELSRADAWDHYIETLRWGLDAVEVLLQNVDAETVIITADHGECFGEWGAYGHSKYGTFDALRKVPWVEGSATDRGEYVPDVEKAEEGPSVEEQLEHLGYR